MLAEEEGEGILEEGPCRRFKSFPFPFPIPPVSAVASFPFPEDGRWSAKLEGAEEEVVEAEEFLFFFLDP